MSERRAILSIRWRRCRLLLEGIFRHLSIDLHYMATDIYIVNSAFWFPTYHVRQRIATVRL